MKKIGTIISYLIEIALVIGLMFYTDDIRYFFIYFLIVFYVKVGILGTHLRKTIKVFQVVNEIKLLSIMKKLKISKKDIQEIVKDVENNLSKDQVNTLYKEMADIGMIK